MTVKSISIPINAARVCQAISKIGYSPTAALKDIIDNSIAAEASNIIVELHLAENKTFSNRNNVERFVIIDDGIGMTDEEVIKAFQLGVDREYTQNSLSKYGLGLKSAGLSLGDRISIISKKNNTITDKYFLDYDLVKETNDYSISHHSTDNNSIKDIDKVFKDSKSGTIIIIDKCTYEKQDSMRKIVNELSRELGVVYNGFLSRKDNPLSITIRQINSEKEDISISPFDILFLDSANSEFDADDYDYVTPCKVLDEEIHLEGVETPIKIQAVAFPQDGAQKLPQLTPEQKGQIRDYKISRSNMGFFIYRNGRLIKWADRIRTSDNNHLVGKDAFGFRAKLSLTSDHDNTLHVDVSKQQILIPEELEKALRMLLRDPINISKEIFKLCQDALTSQKDECEDGAGFSLLAQELGEEDPETNTIPADSSVLKRRNDKLLEKTSQEESAEEENTVEIDDERVFNRVRYTNSVRGNRVYSFGYNADEGTFIRINTNHYFHFTVLSQIPPNNPYKQIIEAMMYCSAVAERFTYTNFSDIDDEKIERVLNKLAELYSYHLDKWCQLNPTILETTDN